MSVFDYLLSGKLPASFVFQDDRCAAFLDIRPISRGHVLVIPRQPRVTLAELEDGLRDELWRLANRIAKAQQRALGSEAQHFLLNDGPVANQSVPHVHLHVIPRYRGDGWQTLRRLGRNLALLKVPPRENPQLRKELDAIAKKIADALD